MIKYSSKVSEWLQHTLVEVSDNGRFRHRLLKEDMIERDGALEELRRIVLDAHEDAKRHFEELKKGSFNPFEDQEDADEFGYPEKLHISVLRGYFGEIFAAIIAEYFSPFDITNWEVPAFLFRAHNTAFEHLEKINLTGDPATPLPGRTGDDCLAFQRDGRGEISRILYCEAKCTSSHNDGMIAEAYQKVSNSVPVSFFTYIEVLRERNTPSSERWVSAIRRARWSKETTYERLDLVSYVCGRHPKQATIWLTPDKREKNYKANRKLESVEVHIHDVDALIREVYNQKCPAENIMQPDKTQQDETIAQQDQKTLYLASRVRESLAGATIPKSLAKLYSEHTLLRAHGSGLSSWSKEETAECLDNALLLLEVGFTEKEAGEENWRESVRRSGEILEWLSHAFLNEDRLPTRYLAGAAYQLAGYPARSSGLLNADPGEENESRILKFLLEANFPKLLNELSKYWGKVNPKETALTLSEDNSNELNNYLQQRILKETIGALGILCATMRWGDDPRLEIAINKLRSVGNVLLHSDDSYSWLLAKLCVEAAEVYIRTSMRYNLTSLRENLTSTGIIALERYLRQCYYLNRALAWPSQIKGIEKLVGESSFVLCTPTGSGKTTIAELAILQSLFSELPDTQNLLTLNDSAPLAIYLVPSRALAAEVESKLSRVLRNLNDPPVNVTGLYGGTDWGPTDAWLTSREQTVLICTYEKAEALVRFFGSLFLHRVSLVVIDEAHSVQYDGSAKSLQQLQQADSRPLRLEALGSRLFTYINDSRGRIIALSAMAAGIEDSIAGWVTGRKDAKPAKTAYRSVRQLIGSLECYPDNKFEIRYDLLDGASLKYKEGRRKDEQPYIPRPFPDLPNSENYPTGAEKHLRPYLFWAALNLVSPDEKEQQHTVLISVTQNIRGYANDLLDLLETTWLNSNVPTFFRPPQETDTDRLALWEKCLKSCEDYFGRNSTEYKLLAKGIVVHHGKMPGLMARLLVDLIDQQVVYLVIATSTLSEGVNLPFETILIPSIRRGTQVISAREFGNLVGRAGRPGYGTEGRSLVVLDARNSFMEQKYRMAWKYREEYEGLINDFMAQGQAQGKATLAQSPLAELLQHLERAWQSIAEVDNAKEFQNWLDVTEPLQVKTSADSTDSSFAALETLDTLDSLLLSAIVELEQQLRGEVSADVLEERLRQIWQRSYAHFASQEESRLQEIYIRRGRALKTKVYPNAHQRRRLYRTGLPPRAGSKLLELYPAFKLKLENGRDYGIWDPKDRFDYIADLVDQLTSLPKYKRGEKADRQKVDWREVLQWWLNPASFTKKTQVNVSTWYKYVSDNFAFRFNWGLGSVVALAADEALLEMFLEPSIENWPIIGLPWIVLWLKELIVWGTLEPVAAYLLSKNLEETRLLAEEAAKSYYAEQSQELTPDELLNPSTIRDWATKRYRPEAYSFDTNPLSQMSVSLSQDFSKVEARIWKVIPVEVDNTLYWYDPAGILLATSERPLTWSDSFLQNYDFTLNIDQKAVSTESYLAFR